MRLLFDFHAAGAVQGEARILTFDPYAFAVFSALTCAPHSLDTGEIPGLGKTLGLRMFVNNLIGNVPFVGPFYTLADILFIFGEERRCLHDHLASTKVVEAE